MPKRILEDNDSPDMGAGANSLGEMPHIRLHNTVISTSVLEAMPMLD